jgi:hypothetical protein
MSTILSTNKENRAKESHSHENMLLDLRNQRHKNEFDFCRVKLNANVQYEENNSITTTEKKTKHQDKTSLLIKVSTRHY